MDLKEFIQNGVSSYLYFEMGVTNPNDFSKLNEMELKYLTEGCILYKSEYMNGDDEKNTYVFYNECLHLHIIHHYPTYETQYRFYKYNSSKQTYTHTKTIWYFMNEKSSFTEYDTNGKTSLRIDYGLDKGRSISGYVNNEEFGKQHLSIFELEKYI